MRRQLRIELLRHVLLEQAAESFYLWRGIRPDTQALRNTMRY